MSAAPMGPVSRNTIADYLDVLTRLMVVEDQPAWSVHLRSSATLRKAAKRHFVDPALAVALLRASPRSLLDDLSLLGLFDTAEAGPPAALIVITGMGLATRLPSGVNVVPVRTLTA